MDAGPGWTLRRFGQTSTILRDGRELLIAGEHEDSYDPDFFIYNDVIVRDPNGTFEMFCYPTEIFPPTDFHSATLVGDRVIIVGSVGYQEQRRAGTTLVFELEIDTLKICQANTTGEAPGWIFKHRGLLSDDHSSIIISGGKIDDGVARRTLVENLDDWRLDLSTMRWERLTRRNWPRWSFSRVDGKTNTLWQIRSSSVMRSLGLADSFEEQQKQTLERLPELIRAEFAEQMRMPETTADINTLYSPPAPHEKIPDAEEEFSVHRIVVDGVTVRFVEGQFDVQLTVEGALPPESIEEIKGHLLRTLSALEQTEYQCQPIS